MVAKSQLRAMTRPHGCGRSPTGREVARLTHEGCVYGAAFSPDGARIATASYDTTARVWEIASGQ